MSDPQVKVPAFISWGVLWVALLLALAGTWWQRGSVAEQQALKENYAAVVREQAILAADQRADRNRINAMEQAIQEQKTDMRWIIEAIRRDEYRKGYVPPPAPSP